MGEGGNDVIRAGLFHPSPSLPRPIEIMLIKRAILVISRGGFFWEGMGAGLMKESVENRWRIGGESWRLINWRKGNEIGEFKRVVRFNGDVDESKAVGGGGRRWEEAGEEAEHLRGLSLSIDVIQLRNYE